MDYIVCGIFQQQLWSSGSSIHPQISTLLREIVVSIFTYDLYCTFIHAIALFEENQLIQWHQKFFADELIENGVLLCSKNFLGNVYGILGVIPSKIELQELVYA